MATTRRGVRKSRPGVRQSDRPVKAPRALQGVIEQLNQLEESGRDGRLELPGGATLSVSSLAKVYFPGSGHTKGDVMRHYVRAAPFILPMIDGRPLVLKRHPEGIEGESFFQQKAPDKTPPGVRVAKVPSDQGMVRRVVGGDLQTLLYCVQLGVIAMNCWHSRIGSLQTPDYTILDLDPGPRASFRRVVQVARWVKEFLDEAGFRAALKTSGKSGMHIYIPLPEGTNEEAALLVAQIFAQRVADAHPKEATTVRTVRERRADAIYVDYLQNVVGKSVASALSVRANRGATVSTPLEWDELTDDLDSRAFTIDSLGDDVARRGRLWTRAMTARNRPDRLVRGLPR
jgi:bifunctional non-homologous end joining protein LigD